MKSANHLLSCEIESHKKEIINTNNLLKSFENDKLNNNLTIEKESKKQIQELENLKSEITTLKRQYESISQENYSISEDIHNTTLSLPISYCHTVDDVMRIVEVMNRF